ncbi:MAG TPA: pyruvate, phosphate dikinase [Phycisphaerales bacterium]|nr:pyruvate, phosphate dikinase [Phycisphaerales bacterium]
MAKPTKSMEKSTPAAVLHEPGKSEKSLKKVARKVDVMPGGPKMRATPGKMVYYFGKTKCEGAADMKTLLGGKGANLADMVSIGLPVPPGFTITTDTCAAYYRNGQRLPHGLMNEVHKNISFLEKESNKKFGDNYNPLLVSVRSGAAVSMPGMMDTILNLGLTDLSVVGLANSTKNARFAYDAYRRLINMFGDVVMGVDHHLFEEAFNKIKSKHHAHSDTDVPETGMIELCEAYKAVYQRHVGEVFPQNPFKQLELAIEAVFKSWNGERAISYRRIQGIMGLNGTAVNIQAMAYGNMGEDSGTGVAFTRNPATGENAFYGEYLVNAQGEDVVAGIRTPLPVDQMPKWNKDVYKQLIDIKNKLEKHYKEMQDIEFTIERGKLFMLQTRTGKRTGTAAVRIACDMVRERLIDEKTALLRIPAQDLTQLLLPSFDASKKKNVEVLTRGIPASPGAAVGKLAFTAEEAVKRAHAGEKVILCRKETSPEDVEGMHSAAGILTSTGGRTSHAAVVACGWGKCCVVGAGEMQIDAKAGTLVIRGKKLGRDDVVSIDGSTGEVMLGPVSTVEPKLSGDFATIMKWSDKYRTMGVRTNADTPEDAQRARDFGAEGIGLCRTEHMFFEGDRIRVMRQMILAETQEARVKALNKLLPFQRDDFIGIFKAMKGLPVTIRLIDPPLHEFLPHDEKSQKEMAAELNVSVEKVRQRVSQLHEANPMLGHRGCRLCVTYPEILDMQVRAIVEAAIDCLRSNIKALPEIMIPLVGTKKELNYLREMVEATINRVKEEEDYKPRLDIKIGTMIEVPRAAVTADEIAQHAEFFSFGTNDLTQMTFGYSRDDVGTFLPDYLSREILPADPFQTLDTGGVGLLIEMGVKKGRSVRNDLKVGICGEHGGDPKSVHFCQRAGLDYVSCSPFRVPIARLAAAQAALLVEKK